jgi:hypothetical protein
VTRFVPVFLSAFVFASAHAQSAPKKTFHDPTYHISFDYPANWTFAQADHEISTFHLDARTAARNANMRAVAAMPENPFPASTFSGAYIYLSVAQHSSEAACARQAVAPKDNQHPQQPNPVTIGGIPFTHGHDEQREICTVQRDEVYTTFRRGLCYRFDLAINNFCGGEVSHVKDITPQELEQVRARLEAILVTVRFDK